MTIEEMKARKTELGYTNERVAELSGVPLGTVQKVFAGETKSPRYDTIQKLTKCLEDTSPKKTYEYSLDTDTAFKVAESMAAYGYDHQSRAYKRNDPELEKKYLKPPKKIIGVAEGKFKMPPDEMFFDDEIAEMFEDI